MKNLFYMFMKATHLNAEKLPQYGADQLSIWFNSWVIDLAQRRNKRISNEANKFMIQKWITNRTFAKLNF